MIMMYVYDNTLVIFFYTLYKSITFESFESQDSNNRNIIMIDSNFIEF